MSLIIPRYHAPPRGYRALTEGPGGLSRRDKDDGPYGLFIHHDETERAYPCAEEDFATVMPVWERAKNDIQLVLWGDQERREGARASLDRLNRELNSQQDLPYRCGWIESQNWYNAGEQLSKAVRDFQFFRSTAVSLHI
jgi:hypothetical protein